MLTQSIVKIFIVVFLSFIKKLQAFHVFTRGWCFISSTKVQHLNTHVLICVFKSDLDSFWQKRIFSAFCLEYCHFEENYLGRDTIIKNKWRWDNTRCVCLKALSLFSHLILFNIFIKKIYSEGLWKFSQNCLHFLKKHWRGKRNHFRSWIKHFAYKDVGNIFKS